MCSSDPPQMQRSVEGAVGHGDMDIVRTAERANEDE